jgi:hypothetical protein
MPISGYLHHLRTKSGHDLVLTPAAAAIIFDGQGRVLLVKHTEGGWGVVGGEASLDGIEVAASVPQKAVSWQS